MMYIHNENIMLSLYQLRAFLEVAQSGTVRGAAERLVVSQPAVSAALAALQRELGVGLVEREGRGLRLTEAGVEVERIGRRLLALAAELGPRAKAAADRGSSWLRFGVVTTAAEHLVPLLLSSFRQLYPTITVDLQVANRAHIWDRLAHGEIDLALGGRPPLDQGFRSVATSPNELVVVAAPGGYHAEALGRATWLLREPGSGTRNEVEEFLAQLDVAPPRLTVGSNGAIRECVRIGLGVSLLPRDAVARDLEAGTLVVIETAYTPISRPWHLVCNADELPAAAVTAFIQHACTTLFSAVRT